MPSTNNIDAELLATLNHESHISKIKSTRVKKKKCQGIAVKYSDEKNLPLMDYKILMRKWSKLVSSAQRNRSKGVKSARATGGAHCTRSGSRFDFGFQQKFQQDINFWCKCFQKMEKGKKSTEGTYFSIYLQ